MVEKSRRLLLLCLLPLERSPVVACVWVGAFVREWNTRRVSRRPRVSDASSRDASSSDDDAAADADDWNHARNQFQAMIKSRGGPLRHREDSHPNLIVSNYSGDRATGADGGLPFTTIVSAAHVIILLLLLIILRCRLRRLQQQQLLTSSIGGSTGSNEAAAETRAGGRRRRRRRWWQERSVGWRICICVWLWLWGGLGSIGGLSPSSVDGVLTQPESRSYPLSILSPHSSSGPPRAAARRRLTDSGLPIRAPDTAAAPPPASTTAAPTSTCHAPRIQ
jgi:hypothetical protein